MGSKKEQRLVVVSNRGPYRQESSGGRRRWLRSAGGLVAALDPVLQNRGGVWVSAEESDLAGTVALEGPQLGYELASIKVPRSDQKGFYQSVSNGILWPLLHSFPTTMRVGEAPWQKYVAANRTFAEGTLDVSRVSDTLWVQDYQLMLVPGMLRDARPKNRIGWFCHVPWPGPDLFSILPWRAEILKGLLGADVVGFHTEEYAINFLSCVHQLTEWKVDLRKMIASHSDRHVRVLVAPIGIAVNDVQTLAADRTVAAEEERIRAALGGRRMILGVDRLDYTKGIPERLRAYEQLLRQDRSAHNRYVYVQVMVPSRTGVQAYADLKNEVDRLVGDINGRYSTTGVIPIQYLYRSLDQRHLYAHYRTADVALVTPLRDGMNLVAHEYVASRLKLDGSLVLSEFAGAAQYLQKGAILVNPYDPGAMKEAIRLALSMNKTETRRRMRALRNEVHKLDVHRWARDYLEALEA